MIPDILPMGPLTVQALRRDLNRYAHTLFVIYARIEQAMHGKTHGIDAKIDESAGSPSVVDALVRKLRKDGFTVRETQQNGAFRISWKKLSPATEGEKTTLQKRGTS